MYARVPGSFESPREKRGRQRERRDGAGEEGEEPRKGEEGGVDDAMCSDLAEGGERGREGGEKGKGREGRAERLSGGSAWQYRGERVEDARDEVGPAWRGSSSSSSLLDRSCGKGGREKGHDRDGEVQLCRDERVGEPAPGCG